TTTVSGGLVSTSPEATFTTTGSLAESTTLRVIGRATTEEGIGAVGTRAIESVTTAGGARMTGAAAPEEGGLDTRGGVATTTIAGFGVAFGGVVVVAAGAAFTGTGAGSFAATGAAEEGVG